MSQNPVYLFFKTPGTLAPVFLRAALTAIFVYHGGQKAFGWFGGDGFSESVRFLAGDNGLGIGFALATASIVIEVAVVPLLLLGLFTRLAGVLVIGLMGGALYFVHGGTTFTDLQFPLLVLAAGLALLFLGGGFLSLDRRISSSLLPQVGGLTF